MNLECDLLIVEDSVTQALKLQHLLRLHGCRTTLARSGPEALALLETQTPDLVLSETIMPAMNGYALCRQIKERAHLQKVAVVLLNSFSDPEGALQAIECGADNWIGKPYNDQSLLALLEATLSHRQQPLEVSASPARLLSLFLSAYQTALQRTTELREMQGKLERLEEHQETAPPAETERRRVLLAEDSIVNQQFARRILEKASYAVVVAGNGKEALSAWENASYDVVLMDMEMPEMGGCETAAAIREREQGMGTHIPILAMTAHDAPEDVNRCLAAGMDGCLTKPLRMEALESALEELSAAPEPSAAEPVSLPVFDQEEALSRVDDDRELLGEILQLFADEAPALLAQVRQAIGARDVAALERAAHTLKGAAASISAPAVMSVSARLETMGRDRDFTGSEEGAAELEHALAALLLVLAQFEEK